MGFRRAINSLNLHGGRVVHYFLSRGFRDHIRFSKGSWNPLRRLTYKLGGTNSTGYGQAPLRFLSE